MNRDELTIGDRIEVRCWTAYLEPPTLGNEEIALPTEEIWRPAVVTHSGQLIVQYEDGTRAALSDQAKIRPPREDAVRLLEDAFHMTWAPSMRHTGERYDAARAARDEIIRLRAKIKTISRTTEDALRRCERQEPVSANNLATDILVTLIGDDVA